MYCHLVPSLFPCVVAVAAAVVVVVVVAEEEEDSWHGCDRTDNRRVVAGMAAAVVAAVVHIFDRRWDRSDAVGNDDPVVGTLRVKDQEAEVLLHDSVQKMGIVDTGPHS